MGNLITVLNDDLLILQTTGEVLPQVAYVREAAIALGEMAVAPLSGAAGGRPPLISIPSTGLAASYTPSLSRN